MSNPFWDYSLFVYDAPGVAAACLSAQDDWGLDVNVVLYAGWLASMGRELTAEHLEGVDGAVVGWRIRAVEPLRRLRRDLKTLPGADELRQQVKALELSAERRQQDVMWRYFNAAPPLPVSPRPLPGNLEAVFGAAEAHKGNTRQRVLAALQGVAEAAAQ